MPMFSWPKIKSGSAGVRPSYMCRSEPQMLVEQMPDHGVSRRLCLRVRHLLDGNLERFLVNDNLQAFSFS